jgi:excisionase family DNA binding protein
MRHEMRKQKDSSLRGRQMLYSEQVLQKLSTLENLLRKSRQAGMPTAKDDKPLTFKEACAYLGYAPSYLYKLTYRKIIPHYKPTGKMIFFSKNELDEWIFRGSDECRVKSNELKEEDASAPLSTKDPNQVDLFEKSEKVKGKKKEVWIEFPLKSRREK